MHLGIHINTTIEVDDAWPCYAHVKGPWLLPLFKLKEDNFIAKYFSEWVVMIGLLGNLKVTKGFHLNPIGEFVDYNESFKTQDAIILAFTSTWRFRFSIFCNLIWKFKFSRFCNFTWRFKFSRFCHPIWIVSYFQ